MWFGYSDFTEVRNLYLRSSDDWLLLKMLCYRREVLVLIFINDHYSANLATNLTRYQSLNVWSFDVHDSIFFRHLEDLLCVILLFGVFVHLNPLQIHASLLLLLKSKLFIFIILQLSLELLYVD